MSIQTDAHDLAVSPPILTQSFTPVRIFSPAFPRDGPPGTFRLIGEYLSVKDWQCSEYRQSCIESKPV